MVNATQNDKVLLGKLREGNERAFSEIYDRYWKAMYQTANNIIRDEAAAQDAVQEIFISLWNRRAETDIKTLKAYLQQATRFAVLKTIKSQKNDEKFYARLRDITTELIVEEPLLFKEQQALLQQVMADLPDDCRETFRLSREEQLTYKQIALQLNISEKTVEKRMTKSLKFFRERLSLALCVGILMVTNHIK